MATDPVCGMEVSEEQAKSMIHVDHETFYFCSDHCKEVFGRQLGIAPQPPKGFWGRLLAKIAKESEKSFGGKPPKCH